MFHVEPLFKVLSNNYFGTTEFAADLTTLKGTTMADFEFERMHFMLKYCKYNKNVDVELFSKLFNQYL